MWAMEHIVNTVTEVEPVWVVVLLVGMALTILLAPICAGFVRHKRWQGSMTAAQTALQQHRYDEAKMMFLTLLKQAEEEFGPEDLRVASAIRHLALLYYRQGRYTVAESLLHRSLAILEKVEPGHIETAAVLEQLAELYEVQGRYTATEIILLRSLAIGERALGPDHPQVMNVITDLLKLYKRMGKPDEARRLEERTEAMRGRDTSVHRRSARFWGSSQNSPTPANIAAENHAT